MAGNEDQDYERLLAEVERSLNPQSSKGGSKPSGGSPGKEPARREEADEPTLRRSEGALVAGVVAAAVVFAVFAILPFFGAFSGAAGAFLGVFVVTFLR